MGKGIVVNENFQRALRGETNVTPPIWFMRQAGRYHSHYQGLRTRHSFVTLCKEPELAAEVAYGPIRDFDFDVAILFSDLLFPLEALGFPLTYDPGPKLGMTLNPQNVHQLKDLGEAIDKMEFQRQAMQATRTRLPQGKSLIGFVGGPWTLFTYACEGEHAGNLVTAKTQIPLYRDFAAQMVPLLIANIEMQLEGGAEMVMVLDTAAGELSPGLFRRWIEPDLAQLVALFPGQVGYYAKGVQGAHMLGLQRDSRWAGFGFDHRWELEGLLQERRSGFVQGNFDQALLLAPPDEFKTHLELYLKPLRDLSPEQRRGWVCGLGHGVLPQTPERSVREFVARLREVYA